MQDFIEIVVEKDRLEEDLAQLFILLSPIGLASFLQTQVGPYLQKRASERFKSEGDEVSGKWAQLKPATVAIRESQQFPGAHPINRREGELWAWVTGDTFQAVPVGEGATMEFPGKVPSGELADKVETAQAGRTSPNTVPRPVLGVNENDLMFVMTALQFNIEAVTG